MFRTRSHRETPSRPTAQRGSVGSARVWDAGARARRGAPEPPAPPPAEPEPSESLLAGVASEELAALVAGIVRVTLDTRLADCGPARREALVRELEGRLRAHFGLPVGPAVATLAPAPEVPAEAVPSEEREPGEDPPTALAPERSEPLDPATRVLWTRLEERLTLLGGELAARVDLRQRLVELGLAVLRAPAGPEDPHAEAGADGATSEELSTLDVLQRRAAKLERSLAEARAALAYVSGLERVETGIASIYRAVQGLGLEDPLRESKRSLLQSIFQANLSLQKPGS